MLGAIAALVKADAAPLKDCIDGCTLARRRMTPKERAQATLPAANAKRAAMRAERRAELLRVISAIMAESPTMAPPEVAVLLNRRNILSLGGRRWTARQVSEILKETS